MGRTDRNHGIPLPIIAISVPRYSVAIVQLVCSQSAATYQARLLALCAMFCATRNAILQDGGGASKHLTQLQRLDFLVLDEADRMVQQGHYQVRGRHPVVIEQGLLLWASILDALQSGRMKAWI